MHGELYFIAFYLRLGREHKVKDYKSTILMEDFKYDEIEIVRKDKLSDVKIKLKEIIDTVIHEVNNLGHNIGWSIKLKSNEKNDIVQVKNPKTERYIKIDRTIGKIISHKKTKGAYKNIPVVIDDYTFSYK